MKAVHAAKGSLHPSRKPPFILPGRTFGTFAAIVLISCLWAGAQQAPRRQFSVQVETQLVQVHVRVVGRDGKPVTGLNKKDFSIKANGHRQQVSVLDYVSAPAAVQESNQTAPNTAVRENIQPQTPGRHVWIYVDTEVDSDEVSQAYQAIKKFLSSELQPGFMVSLDGLPFTDDRARLLATLEKMRQGPFGHLPDVPPLINSTLDMEKQADYEWLLYSALLYGGSLSPPVGFARMTMRQGMTQGGGGAVAMQQDELKQEMQTTEQEMSFYVRSALFRYLDIIYRMEALQGQKAVVIFRSGLRMDPDNVALLRRAAADAMRHQIVFYTVDTRGLYTIDPSTNQAKLLRYGVPIPFWAVQSSVAFLRALDDYERTDEVVRGREEGLTDVALLTGGKAVTNTNDLNTVFKGVLEDSSGYYVVGFYPTDKRQSGRFRRIKVSVDVPAVKVYAPKGYYEPLPFKELSKREKEIVLWQALQSEMPRDLPVSASVNVFRGENGEPVAVVSTGVRLGALSAKREKNAAEVQMTELAEIGAVGGGTLPAYYGQTATVTVANCVYSQPSPSSDEFVTFTTQVPVTPGKHIYKVVFRDDSTGKLGAEEVQFEAGVFGPAPAVSSLMVTHHVAPIPADTPAGKMKARSRKEPGLLQAGDLKFVPQPEATFQAGDKIYFLYKLYNPGSYNFDALAASARTVLLFNAIAIRQFNINWRILPEPNEKMVDLIGTLDTSNFAAGDYRVVQSVPIECGTGGKLGVDFTLTANPR